MTNQLQSELQRAAVSTFEDLGFVFPEPELTEVQSLAPIAWSASVAFRGPVAGALEIRVSDGVARHVAANMLGLAEDAPVDAQRDALGEIANVVCGNLVPTLGLPQDVFNLDAPVLAPVHDTPGTVAEPAARVTVGIDEGRAELTLYLGTQAGEGVSS